MNILFRILVTSILVLVISYFFPSIAHVDGVNSAIIVAIVLGLLNVFIKPVLVLFTLPVTIFSLGLFLLVINAAIIALCTKLVGGFSVNGFFGALLFSIILSISQSIVYKLSLKNK
ncbi:phage holin family protein [Flavobacterium sp.]|uniref:phage holin family protein n=1 Tax=Flavobacterium sp. TaxID=239 RepID=UPI003BB9B080